jgi:hypothetical protein
VSELNRRPLVSPKAGKVLAALSALMGAASAVLPAFVPAVWATGTLLSSALLAFAAGLALPQLRIAAGRPLVPVAVATPLGALAALLLQVALTMGESTLGVGLGLVAALLAFVAGKAIDMPSVPAAPTTPEEALAAMPAGELPVASVTGQQVKAALEAMPQGQK